MFFPKLAKHTADAAATAVTVLLLLLLVLVLLVLMVVVVGCCYSCTRRTVSKKQQKKKKKSLLMAQETVYVSWAVCRPVLMVVCDRRHGSHNSSLPVVKISRTKKKKKKKRTKMRDTSRVPIPILVSIRAARATQHVDGDVVIDVLSGVVKPCRLTCLY